MNHEELLERLGFTYENHQWVLTYKPDRPREIDFRNALRAVVELHHPNMDNNCSHCWNPGTNYLEPYPCITIQAIEKELK